MPTQAWVVRPISVSRLEDEGLNLFGHWPEVSANEVTWAFLCSEFDQRVEPGYRARLLAAFPGIVNRPNFNDPHENLNRHLALQSIRSGLLHWLPLSTRWSKTRLKHTQVDRLRVFGRSGLDGPHDRNEVTQVAARVDWTLTAPPSQWKPVVLWGHDRRGPFTILEGNHRIVSAVRSGVAFDIEVYVGLSSDFCYWHLPDPVRLVKPVV